MPLINTFSLQTMRDFSISLMSVVALFIALTIQGNNYTFYREALILFLLLALMMVKLFKSYNADIALPNTAVILLFAAFVSWVTLSIFWSAVLGDSFLMTLFFYGGLVAMLLGFWATDKQWHFYRVLLIPLALAIIAMTSYQAFVLKMERPTGFLMNWNTNSAFLGAILVPYCADYLRQTTEKQPIAWFTGLFLASCSFAMALGQGRASLLVLFLALGVLFFTYRLKKDAFRAIGFTLFWVVGGFVLGDLLHGGFLAQRLISTAQTTATLENMSSLGSGREYLWSAGWKMYLDRPFLGWGINVFHSLYPSYHSPLHIEDGNFVHNDYLQFLIELGPVGLLLCLGWIGALFLQTWRLFNTPDTEQRVVDVAIFLACAAMLLHSVVDFHLYHAPMLLLLGSYVGRLSQQYQKQYITKPATVKFADISTARHYFGILSVISLFLSMVLLNVSISFLSFRNAEHTKEPLKKFQKLTQAQHFLPFVELFQTLPGLFILDFVENDPNAYPIEIRDKLIVEGLEYIDQAIQNNALRAENHQYKARLLLLLRGDSHEISHEFEQSIALNPYQLDVRLMFMRYLESINAEKQARHVLEDGFNKSYFDKAAQVNAFYKQVDLHIDDSPAFAIPKKAIKKEIEKMNQISPKTVQTFTLPDIGWNP